MAKGVDGSQTVAGTWVKDLVQIQALPHELHDVYV